MLFRILYQLAISCYHAAIRIAAIWSPKAKLWVRGRTNQWQRITDALQPDEQRVWFHCASLGEFEQGRPVIEALRQLRPDLRMVLTFYSPSGYEIRKDYPHADYVFYLPADSPQAARRWLDVIQPKFVIFVKYEFWYFYLTELQKRQVSTFLISAVFRADQWFFGSFGAGPRKMLGAFTQLFVQDENSAKLLALHGFDNVTIAGDTRVDRVADMVKHAPENVIVSRFSAGNKTVICGSTWPPDELLLSQMITKPWAKELKWVFAPHDIQERHLVELVNKLSSHVATSEIVSYSHIDTTTDLSAVRVLVIDNIGLLSGLYRYGWVAYIGGGFGTGIHNTLEPAAWGLPIVFGPKFNKFEEAKAMLASGAAATINDVQSLEIQFQDWLNPTAHQKATLAAQKYISEQCGSTDIIMKIVASL